MEVFLFSDETGAYIEPYMCQESPLVPGEYIEPLRSSRAAPEMIIGFWPVMMEGVWVNVEDHRGTVWDTVSGNPVDHDLLGPLPGHLTALAPPPLSSWGGGQWLVDAGKCAAARVSGVGRLKALAEARRNLLLTPGSGKAQAYRCKEAEVNRYDAIVTSGGVPSPIDVPWMAARSAMLSVSLLQVRNEWAGKIDAWVPVGIAIESIEESVAEHIKSLPDSVALWDQIDELIQGIVWP